MDLIIFVVCFAFTAALASLLVLRESDRVGRGKSAYRRYREYIKGKKMKDEG